MREVFRAALPRGFFLEADNRMVLEGYLRERGWIGPMEPIASVGKAGEGNMNLTLRVTTPRRSLVLKQARPWVEKYPAYAAPVERARVEARFYALTGVHAGLRALMPAHLGADDASCIQCFEDLGEAADCTDLYGQGDVSEEEEADLLAWLGALHQLPKPAPREAVANLGMRALNHAHIFEIPYADPPALDLDAITPGLSALAAALRRDSAFTSAIAKLGRVYLDDGPSLLHGDFYPGSWLRASGGVRVIDPEFAFHGRPEFDVGVFLAHFAFGRRRMVHFVAEVVRRYRGPADFRWPLAMQFAGAELTRRLLGVAQLPLRADLAQKRAWLKQARRLVLEPQVESWR